MKKALSLLLALVMLLTFCACGMSKEEMLKEAETLDWIELSNEYLANNTRTKDQYDGKIMITDSFYVASIGKDYISGYRESVHAAAYLSKEDLMKVTVGKTVKVVGIIDVQAGSAYDHAGQINFLDAYIVD